MTNFQNAYIGMYQRVKLVFQKFILVWGTVKALDDTINFFTTKQGELADYIKQQGLGSSGVTVGKDALKEIMIHQVLILVKKVRPYFKSINDAMLMDLFDVTDKDFRGDELIAVALAENIVNAVLSKIKSLKDYNVTDAETTFVLGTITDFNHAVGTPQLQKGISKQVRFNINNSIKIINAILDDTDDLVMGNFEDSKPDEVAEYKSARFIGKIVGQHTAVAVHVYADDAQTIPVVGAVVSIDVLKRHDDTDADGKAEIVKFRAGSYTLVVKANGYPDTSIPFTVKNGKHVSLDIVLQTTGVKGTATQNSKPTAGLHVRVVGTNFTTLTDADGHFSIIGLLPGTYLIEVANEGGDTASATVVVVNGVMSVVDLAI